MTKLLTLSQADKDIIDYIKQARIKKNITQTQLAEMLNIARSLIGNAESYKQKYSNLTIRKLLKALELEPIKEWGVIEKVSSTEIDLYPMLSPNYKIKLLLSDKFIDNNEDLNILQLKNKGSILIDNRTLSLHNNSELDNKKYYAVIINDDSMIPIAFKGDYLIIKFDKLAHDNFLLTEKRHSQPKLFILKSSDNNILIRHIKTLSDDKYNYIYYAFLYSDEESLFNCRVFGEFYFKKGKYKIIGEVIAVIRTEPRLIKFKKLF